MAKDVKPSPRHALQDLGAVEARMLGSSASAGTSVACIDQKLSPSLPAVEVRLSVSGGRSSSACTFVLADAGAEFATSLSPMSLAPLRSLRKNGGLAALPLSG